MNAPGDPFVDYYARRAPEYEAIYGRDDPVARAELEEVRELVRTTLRDRRVLEVACGTGYWTAAIAGAAESVVAIDAAPEVLDEARKKDLDATVDFRLADAYDLGTVDGAFDAALAAFWLSHIPRRRTPGFLRDLHRRLEPGATVVMFDNVFVPHLGGELLSPEDADDTFKRRTLSSGEEFEILKNYYSEDELAHLFADARDLRIHVGQRYWSVVYSTPGAS